MVSVITAFRGRSLIGDGVFASPYLGVRGELRLRRERPAEFAVVAVQIEAWAERGQHELRELAKPVAEGPLVAGQRRITTSDRLEVFGGAAGHIEHVSGWRAQLEGAALVIVNVVANATEHVDWIAAHSCGLHEQPSGRRHDPDRSPHGPSNRVRHVFRAEEFRTGGAVGFSGVPRWIDQGRGGDLPDIFVGGWRVAAITEHPGEDTEIRGHPNRHQVYFGEEARVDDRMCDSGSH